jgi:hypothetical protein
MGKFCGTKWEKPPLLIKNSQFKNLNSALNCHPIKNSTDFIFSSFFLLGNNSKYGIPKECPNLKICQHKITMDKILNS